MKQTIVIYAIAAMLAVLLPLTVMTPAVQGGGVCRSVSRAGQGHRSSAVATHYFAHKKAVHYGHQGYAAFVAVEPYYAVDVVGADIRAVRAKAQRVQLQEEVQKLQIELEVMKDQMARQAVLRGEPLPLSQSSSGAGLEITEIIRKRCAECHSGEEARSKFQLFGSDKRSPTQWGAREIYLIESVTNDNSMPPGAPLPEKEYKAIRKWYEDNRGDVRALLLKKKEEE